MRKKIITMILMATMTLLTFAGCGTGSVEEAQTTTQSIKEDDSAKNGEEPTEKSPEIIRVGVQLSTYVPFLTQELGYFKDNFGNTTEVELVTFSAGSPMVEAMNSGELDFAFLGDTPAFSGLVNGGEYTIIGKYSVDTAKALLVRKDADINSLEDLKGHTYATTFGSNIQPLAEIFLEEAGLAHNDVEYTNLSLADINTSIINGDIDAAVTNEPNISKILAATDEVKILATADGRKQFVSPIIGANEFLKKYPDVTATFLKSLQSAADWSHENRDEAIEKIASATGLETDTVTTLFDSQDNNVYLTDEQVESLKNSAIDAYKYELITKELDVETYIDRSYAESAGIGR